MSKQTQENTAVEARVKARLDAEANIANNAAEKALEAFTKARADLDKATAKHTAAIEKVMEGMGKKVTPAVMDAPAKAVTEIGKKTRAFVRAKAEYVAACDAAEALTSPKEYERRLKLAKKVGHDEPVTGKEAAQIVLLSAGKPMHYTEITRQALESGVLRLDGKTPEATMSAYLAKAAKKGDTFVRVAPGTFDLADRIAKAKQAKAKAASKTTAAKAA